MKKEAVLKLDARENRVKEKALTKVIRMDGVDSVAMDVKGMKLKVTGDDNMDLAGLVVKLEKHCHIDIVSVGPAKEPEKKKDEPKKDDQKKPQEQKKDSRPAKEPERKKDKPNKDDQRKPQEQKKDSRPAKEPERKKDKPNKDDQRKPQEQKKVRWEINVADHKELEKSLKKSNINEVDLVKMFRKFREQK